MPRAIWSGSISFGLVNVPVKLVTAVSKKNVSFREIRREDGSRIRHRKVAAADGEEVTPDEIVKGYEIAPDRYVVVEPEELKSLDPKASRTIDIEDFVDIADIDPIFFDSPYYLVPDRTAGKAYQLLRRAMQETGKVGVARFVLRTKQYLAAVRPIDGALAISTMVYNDEVVPVEQLEIDDEDIELSEKELTMATQLIESLAIDWQPERYTDDYRGRVLELIERKAEGEEIVSVPDEERTSGDVVDLMSALEASLQAAKDNAKGKGGKAKSASKKKAAS